MPAIPVVHCRNVQESLAFYTRILDFEKKYPEARDTDWVIDLIRRDSENDTADVAEIQLSQHAGDGAFGCAIIRVHGVDACSQNSSRAASTPPDTTTPPSTTAPPIRLGASASSTSPTPTATPSASAKGSDRDNGKEKSKRARMEDFVFNLSLNEGYFEEDPRKCRLERQVMVVEHRTIAMLVSVSPPFSGERYCIDTPEINFALVGPRLGGDGLFPISTWPMPVNIGLPAIARPELRESISYKEVVLIGIGLLYLDGKDVMRAFNP